MSKFLEKKEDFGSIMKRIESRLIERLDSKNSWGKREIISEYRGAVNDVLIDQAEVLMDNLAKMNKTGMTF
jgi:hypothetical protein